MKRTTLGQAISWVANKSSGYGFTLPDEREEARELVNRILEEIYEGYPNLQFQNDVEECFKIQRFSLNCYDCGYYYYGITLPHYMSGETAAWTSKGEPMPMYSKWREAHTGRYFDSCYEVSLHDVAGLVATERDIIGGADRVGVKSTNQFSNGNHSVIIKVEYENGEQEDISICLYDDFHYCDGVIRKIISVVLPLEHDGGVVLVQERGERRLSEYHPQEHVPSYKRVKILSPCPKGQILIRAAREFNACEQYWDTDVLPIGSRRVFEEGAKYFKLRDDGSSNQLIERAEYHRSAMIEKVNSILSRQDGGVKHDITRLLPHEVRKGRLPTNRF